MAQRPIADFPVELGEERFSFYLDTSTPLRVDEVLSIINGVREEYFRYILSESDGGRLVERSLFISELETGSLFAEFALAAVALTASVPTIAQQNVLIDYARNLKSGFDYLRAFATGDAKRKHEFPDKRAQHLRELAAPVITGINKGIAFKSYYKREKNGFLRGKEVEEYSFELLPDQAAQVVKGADKFLNAKPRRGQVLLKDIELKFDRTVAKPSKANSRASHKTIIADESPKPVSTKLASEMNERRIVDWWSDPSFNPFTSAFRADVIAEYNDKGDPISYTILSIRESN